MEIIAELRDLKFKPTLLPPLREFTIDDFICGKLARTASYVLNYKNESFGISQWVSPKRTRSYPYARVYDTMSKQNRITIIPFIKDEGFDGDRDFVQWDTISLMSLLNVYVILAYYKKAQKNLKYENKIGKADPFEFAQAVPLNKAKIHREKNGKQGKNAEKNEKRRYV